MPETLTDLGDRIQITLDRDVRPYLQCHGGDVDVVAVRPVQAGSEIVVRLGGACRHCELRTVTFAARVRTSLLALPDVEKVTCEGITLSPARLQAIASFFG